VREVKSVRFKRIHIQPGASDKAGHWWFEIGDANAVDSESYGWWPASALSSLTECFKGVPGQLNDGGSIATLQRDPHHGEDADEEFSPLVDDERSDKEVADCLRVFAKRYKGSWQWFVGWGKNCHSFQRAALKHCKLTVPDHIRRVKI
jgi:hypothetical protein